jgi:aminopeptidase B
MFAQRRIMDKLFGTAYTCLEAETGLALLRQHMDDSGEVIYISLLNYFYAPAMKSQGHINLPPVRPFVCWDIDTWFVRLSPPTVLELQL